MLAIVLGAIALLIAACGSDSTPTSVPTIPNAPTPTPTVATNAAGTPIVLAGSNVSVHYHGTLDDGEVFDSSLEREPLSFTVAAGQMIPGFDAAVQGMALGEKKTVRLEAADAYGERRDEAIITQPRETLPDDITVGQQLFSPHGGSALVMKITETEVTLDLNHPLAGQALTFEITIVEIN